MSYVLKLTIMRHTTLPTDLAIVPPGCSSPIMSSSLLRFAIISNKRGRIGFTGRSGLFLHFENFSPKALD